MKTSARGRRDIARHEGTALKAYRDSAGILTIGVGHTSMAGPPNVVPGMRITAAEADEIFARDLARFEMRAAAALGQVPQNVFDGAVSFDFNTGAIHKASWVKAYCEGKMVEAERRLMMWNKAGGRPLKGLTNRRGAEADLIFRGRYRSAVTLERAAATAALAAAPASAALAVMSGSDSESAVETGLILAGVVLVAALLVFAGWRWLHGAGGAIKAEG